jgi:hypothetical protein
MLNVPMTVVLGTSWMPVATLMVLTAVCPVKCRSSKYNFNIMEENNKQIAFRIDRLNTT